MSAATPSSPNTKKVNEQYIPVREAAGVSSYTTAHITRLAKQGRVRAIKRGKQWFIDPVSLKDFNANLDLKKSERRRILSEERLTELSRAAKLEEPEVVTSNKPPVHGFFSASAALQAGVCTLGMMFLILVGSDLEPARWAALTQSEEREVAIRDTVVERVVMAPSVHTAAAFQAPVLAYVEKAIDRLWCGIAVFWQGSDQCRPPAVEYAILPQGSASNPRATILNFYTTEVRNYGGIREIIIQDQPVIGLTTDSQYVLRSEYDRQVEALLRSIENIDGGTTIVQGGGGSGADNLEDLNDVAAMTKAVGDLLIWNGTAWTNAATSSLGIVGAGAVDSVNGQTGHVVLDTADILENGNLYFTAARARESIASGATGLSYATSTGLFTLTPGYTIPLIASTTEWATAFGWGNHATAGYLTTIATSTVRNMFSAGAGLSYSTTTGQFTNNGVTSIGGLTGDIATSSLGIISTESDPIFASSTAALITGTDISNWNAAFGWGDHSVQGYIKNGDNATTSNLTVTGSLTTNLIDGCVEVVNGVLTSLGLNCGTSTSSAGILNLNGLTSSGQSFNAVVSGGLAFNINSVGSIHTFNISPAANYTIPLTASTTDWTNFFNTPSTRITAGTNLSWSGNTLNGTFGTSSARASISETITGIDYDTNTGVFSLTSGYTIPLTASTTAWNNTTNLVNASSTQWGTAYTLATLLNAASSSWNAAYASTTALTPAYIRGLFSTTATGLSYNNTTGVTSLTPGYTIPLTASTTEWATAFGWGNHATAGYLSTTTAAATYYPLSNPAGYTNSTGTVTSVGVSVPTGFTVSNSPITASGTIAISLASGYVIPLTASTTAWNNFYNTPSTRITAGTNLSWSGNTLNFVDPGYLTSISTTTVRGMFSAASPLSYNSGTGQFSLGTIDISSNTNLTVGNGITLNDDTLTVTAAGGLAQTTGGLTTTGVLEDLHTTGVAGAADLFLVSTGAGAMAWENATTARGSMGLGSIATLNTIDISSNTNLGVTAAGLTLSGDNIALTPGYTIPLTASTTDWTNFFNTPSTRITAGSGLSWSGNTLNASSCIGQQGTSASARHRLLANLPLSEMEMRELEEGPYL